MARDSRGRTSGAHSRESPHGGGNGRLGRRRERPGRAIPALAAGILSPSAARIGLVGKADIRRRAGVKEYRIFGRRQETVRISRFPQDAEKPVAVHSFAETLRTPLPPELSLEMPKVRQALRFGGERRKKESR
ncbi:Uma2 family endonuclease [Methylacidimicrobium sp. AP8]|uniref:Uma2 family endonuclease n=1 Tax=Methylacidimicrobium sp. AP8 TaxID=2730359 RepID=UPI001F3873D6|nr:Uma2 family endonuclease [Methylacidimicrobium sp. AP8]